MLRRATVGLGIALLLPCIISGCNKGPNRYEVSGSVNFAGQPIPDGWVVFSPDSSKKNTGPQGRARIVNGKFSTSEKYGLGTVSGPMLVRIDGFDGIPFEQMPNGKPIMAPYNTTIDLPKDATEITLEVPAEWKKQRLPAVVP